MTKVHNGVQNCVIIFLFAAFLVNMSGCSVVMALRQPEYKNLNVLTNGTPRSKLIAEFGQPVLTESKDGKRIDIFAFKQGYSKGNKALRAFFYAAADVWTLCLWEVFGTPIEIIASGKNMKAEVGYDKDDRVEHVTMLDAVQEPSKKAQPIKAPVQEKDNKGNCPGGTC